VTALGLAAAGLVPVYLAALLLGSGLAAEAAGRPVWLLGRSASPWSARGYRVAFTLSFFGPLLLAALPVLHDADPLWREAGGPLGGVPGLLLAVAGALLAVAGQAAMGASWRVGVADDAVGELVTKGPFRVSRNPVFAGQALLLAGVALAVPSLPGALAALLFAGAAAAQVRAEERALEARHGAGYRLYRSRVPRWLGPARRGAP
jgi:protein-S-isoprenylcysteine O-methyltransferase Ste14